MKKTLTITALAAALALTGCGGSDDTTAEDDKAPAGEDTTAITDRLEKAEEDLEVFFEDCDWDNTTTTDTVEPYALGSCEESNLVVLTSESDAMLETFITGAAEEAPVGKYFIHEGLAAFSPDDGTLNQAWDALGADGTPKHLKDLVK